MPALARMSQSDLALAGSMSQSDLALAGSMCLPIFNNTYQIMDHSCTNRSLCLLSIGALLILSCSSCSSSSSSSSEATDPMVEEPSSSDFGIGFRLERIDADSDNDLVVDEFFELMYDDTGLSIGELIDDNADGIDDHRFTYDYADGRLVGSSYDQDYDGSIDVTRVFTYDADGFLQSLTINRNSGTGRTDYFLGDNDRLTGAQVDRDGDSVVDEVAIYQYNSAGRISTIDFDTDGNSATDIRINFVYDEEGRVIRRERDVGVDGSIESIWSYFYVQALCHPASNHQPLNHSCIF